MITFYGGKLQKVFDETCTHLITGKPSGVSLNKCFTYYIAVCSAPVVKQLHVGSSVKIMVSHSIVS